MKLQTSTALVSAAVLSIALVSCGNNGGDSADPAAASAAAPATMSPEQIEPSIVYIRSTWTAYVEIPGEYTEDGQTAWSEEVTAQTGCTGFFVSDDGMVATAGHCVDAQGSGREMVLQTFLTEQGHEDLLETAMMNWRVEGEEGGSPVAAAFDVMQPANTPDTVLDGPATAQLIDFQPFNEGDNALLRINGQSGAPALDVAAQTPDIGTPLTAIGFPGVVGMVADQAHDLPRPSFKTGNVSSKQTLPSGAPVMEVSADIGQGMSGGPSVNEQGQVLGVNSANIPGGSGGSLGFAFITDTEDLNRFLTRNGVE